MATPVRRWAVGLGILAALVAPVRGDDRAGKVDKEALIRQLTATINRHIAEGWSAHGVTPADPADDAEWVRRVYLDLVGRIPKVAEARTFLADAAPDKRAKLVERLLGTPSYARHFAALTRADWLPPINDEIRFRVNVSQFEDWLRRQYAANTPADQVARQILTAAVQVGQRGRMAFDQQERDPDAFALSVYYQAHDVKPENLAASATRIFLGFKLECAQCHDHPFAPYTKDQFWQFAAFFGEFTPLPPTPPSFVGPPLPQYDLNRLTIPGTTRTVTARFIDGTDPEWTADRTPRQVLAEWLTSPANPYFARNLANRLWARLFGVGIIDPVDEPGDDHPPSHPALLDDLAAAVVASGFDQRVLIRAIAASKAYNLSSRQTHPTQADPRLFARMSLRGLTANQIYDSFLAATGHKDNSPPNQQFFDPRDANVRSEFKTLFPATGKPTESQTSILQALMMMNGKPVADETSLDKSEVLAAVADAPFLTSEKRVEALFLAALTRKPTTDEKDKFVAYIDRGGPSGDKNKALADVFWVLLNSTEFLFNH